MIKDPVISKILFFDNANVYNVPVSLVNGSFVDAILFVSPHFNTFNESYIHLLGFP
jgi:uncharacterized membrane protein YczE